RCVQDLSDRLSGFRNLVSIGIPHLVGPRWNVIDDVRRVRLESNAYVMCDAAVTRQKLDGRNPGIFRETTRHDDIGPFHYSLRRDLEFGPIDNDIRFDLPALSRPLDQRRGSLRVA